MFDLKYIFPKLINKNAIESIPVSKWNRPQRGFAPVAFNNQIELERDTSMIKIKGSILGLSILRDLTI